ncbi:unnamed protein product [Allacma fusca]|uniref:limulus clotting factor C n=1 Tax=Allacma fusca TaxID=39272 RepID=A0A8J2JPH3_9HEXA|nr:unnamed protein product [Allacma fusca]
MLLTHLVLALCLLCRRSSASRPCESLDDRLGTCISIVHCPTLLHMIHSKNRAELRKLQLLTCGFHGSTPKVCCPIDEVKKDDVTNNSLGDVISFNSTNNVRPDSKTLQNHPNFRNFPSLASCSRVVTTERIIGGREVPLGSYPWMARIGYQLTSGEIIYGCGGAVINERYILTAAHCIVEDGVPLHVQEISLSEHDTRTDPDCTSPGECSRVKYFKVEKIITHPEYNVARKHHDVALIRLAEPIDFKQELYIQPVCLPFIKEYGLQKFMAIPDQYAVSAGWGKTHWNRVPGSHVLQEVKVPVITNEDCTVKYSGISAIEISHKQLCAGGQQGFDTCEGDSGGPLMWLHKHNQGAKFFQIGIVSFGPTQCGSGALPGVYTRVTGYLDWIVDHVVP